MQDTAGHFLYRSLKGTFLVQFGIGNDAVTLALLVKLGNHGRGLIVEFQRLGSIGRIHLHHGLGMGPDIVLVHNTKRRILWIDVDKEQVPVHLEEAGKAARRHVGKGEQRLPLCEVRRIPGQCLTNGHAKVCLPLGSFNHHQDLTGLSTHIGKNVALCFALAAGKNQHASQKNP